MGLWAALFSRGTRAVVYRDFITWLSFARSSFVANLAEPLLYLLAIGVGFGRLVERVGGHTYLEFMAPALLASSAMNGATFETTYSSFTRLHIQKTFDAIITTPVSVDEVVAGEVLWAVIKCLISVTVIFAVYAAFGLLTNPWAAAAIPVAALSGFLFASLGMLMTGYARGYDFFTFYFYLFVTPMFLFSGTFFPLDGLPGWAQRLAWFLPLTHSVRMIRSFFYGEVPPRLAVDAAWLILAGMAVFGLAVARMRRRLIV